VKTEIVSARTPQECAQAIALAAQALRDGEAIALPTETVYGLAADALNPAAVAKIFEAKERPRFDPLIVHLPGVGWLEKVAVVHSEPRPLLESLIAKFWPGPLTFVLPRKNIVPDLVTAGLETVAVRISAHPVFVEIIHEFGRPLAAPSANRFGRISPTTAEHVRDELDGRISMIVDAGPTTHGIESTIIAIRSGELELLRRGPVTEEELSEFGVVTFPNNAEMRAPGQLPSHYAPTKPLRLIDDAESFSPPPDARCALLAWKTSRSGGFPAAGFGKRRSGERHSLRFVVVRQFSGHHDLREAAANLFRHLRELDAMDDVDLIIAEEVPNEGLGKAINDRLRRAANM
jgi:L-threonylcarbamoyladenylate synthase